MPRESPKRFSDRVKIEEVPSQLIITIKTVEEPDTYTVYEVYIFGDKQDEQIILNSKNCLLKKIDNALVLTIPDYSKKFEIAEVGVLLSRKGKQEYYSMSKKVIQKSITEK